MDTIDSLEKVIQKLKERFTALPKISNYDKQREELQEEIDYLTKELDKEYLKLNR